MKNLKYFTTFFFALLFSLTLQANDDCEAPAPNSAEVTEVSPTSVSLVWEEVPGAASYQVRVDDPYAVEVGTYIVYNNNFTLDFLDSNVEYSFYISASYCDEGPYGGSLLLKGKTTIIIVDDIVQIECPGTPTAPTSSVPNNSITLITMKPAKGGCYLLNATTTTLGANNFTFDLALSTNAANDLYVGNYITNPTEFEMINNGNGNVLGEYTTGNGMITASIFILKSYVKNGNTVAKFIWKQGVNLSITYCVECSVNDKNFVPLATSSDEPAKISVYPNPGKDLINIQLSNQGYLEIWDIAGRKWYTAKLNDDLNNLKLFINDWPSGTYILRWHQDKSDPVLQHFIKLD